MTTPMSTRNAGATKKYTNAFVLIFARHSFISLIFLNASLCMSIAACSGDL